MAVIAKQRYKLDIAPKGGWVIVYASQHDNGAREIEFEITNQGRTFSIPASINISVQGVKSNRGYFSHSCSYSGNIVKMALANDMTDVIGKAICVLKFTNSSQQKLATAKFILNVDSDSSSEGIIIDTEAEEIFDQMLDEIRAQAASVSADIAELQSMVGSPLVASTASAMTNHNKIYVYTGSESGYTNGNWYYWNGSAWTSGGVYNSVAVNIDSVPTAGSTNPVQSGGVKNALDGVRAEIPIVDSAPTQGSSNAVSSGGVFDAIKNFAPDHKYLFVGDSYAEGYSHDGNNSGWCQYLINYLGLTSDKYEIVYHGGWGFANGGYTSLLDNAIGSGFTDIVACGGYNDNAYTEAQISSGIEAFKNKALSKWPNAKIHIGFIAYNKEGNGTGAVEEWAEKREALFDIVLPTYQKCTVFGCSYLNNVECWLREDGLTPSDGYHPSADGNQTIAKAVANALMTGSAPLPNERYEITDDIKKALLQCLEKIAWKDNTGRVSFLALANALHVKISNRREELPDTYEQVEFIKSTRAQYIALTDILTQIPIDIKVKASLETMNDRTGGYLVSALGSGTQRFYAVTYTNSKMAARIGNNNWTEVTVTDEVVIGQPYQIETSISYASGGDANLVVKYDLGQQSAVLTAQSISGVDGHTLALFASDASGGTRGVWALYEIVIYSGRTKIFDGIPCYRKSDNKTGLFDAVNNSFYPNATTTEFVVGDIVE